MKTVTNVTRELPRPQTEKPSRILEVIGLLAFLGTTFHLVHRVLHEAEWQMPADLIVLSLGYVFTLYAIDPDRADRLSDKVLGVFRRKSDA